METVQEPTVNEQDNPASKDNLEASLARLRKRMIYIQDEFQITSFSIRCIEADLQELEKQDGVANAKNA